MKEQEPQKVEFLMTLNDRIIVQRFFNVRGYNHKNRNSVELNEYLTHLVDGIKYNLKMKTVEYMMDNRALIESNPSVLNTSMTEDAELFNIQIKLEDTTICHRQFDAKLFPPKVRYTVDIRPFIKNALYELTDIFSSKNLTFEYLGLPTNV